MKKYIKWWLQRFILCTFSLIAVVSLVYASPKVVMQNSLGLEIMEQSGVVADIISEQQNSANGVVNHKYELLISYDTPTTRYHRVFVVNTTYVISVGDVIPVKYYSKHPKVVYAFIDNDSYAPKNMRLAYILFNLSIFVGIPVGCYTLYFLKKKKKPRIPKKKE